MLMLDFSLCVTLGPAVHMNHFIRSYDEVTATEMLLGKANLTGYQVITMC